MIGILIGSYYKNNSKDREMLGKYLDFKRKEANRKDYYNLSRSSNEMKRARYFNAAVDSFRSADETKRPSKAFGAFVKIKSKESAGKKNPISFGTPDQIIL